MTRPLSLLCLLILLLLIVRGSEAVLEAILDNELPPLLTEELGLPVRIAPLRTDIFSLTARTDRLEMGEPDNLSVDARDVRVSLNWLDLLRGEIRLVAGDGGELMLDISAWPEDDGPPSEDYAYLEQWLPSTLDVELVRYRREDGSEIEFHDARWRRAGEDRDNASLAWQSRFPTGRLDIDIDLASLDDFLWLRRFDASLTLATDIPELPISELALAVKPGGGRVYDLALDGELAGLPLEVRASGSEPWSLPDRSHTRARVIDVGIVGQLIQLFVADGKQDAYAGELAATLPALDLPRHDASVDIAELHMDDEMLHDVSFELTARGNFLAATRIGASGLYGDLLGSAAAASAANGWEVAVAADVRARAADDSLLKRYVDTDFNVRKGRIRLQARGTTAAGLFEDLRGAVSLSGIYRAEQNTPVDLSAKLDSSPSRMAIEQIKLQIGESALEGSIAIATRGERSVKLRASGGVVDLGFLFAGEEDATEPGIPLPATLPSLPDYRLAADISLEGLHLSSFQITAPRATLELGREGGKIDVSGSGPAGGTLDVSGSFEHKDDSISGAFDINLQKTHVLKLFGLDQGAIDSRTSGKVSLSGAGRSPVELLSASRGQATLQVEIREDGDWSRTSSELEVVKFQGQAAPLVRQNVLVGLALENIDIDSLQQNLDGSLSLDITRTPVMIADLTSEQLNLDQLTDWLPESPAHADERGILSTLRDWAPGQLELHIDALTWLGRQFDQLSLVLDSKPGYFAVEEFGFMHRGASFTGNSKLFWQDQNTAKLNSEASIKDLRLRQALDLHSKELEDNLDTPLSGQLRLEGTGETLEELVVGLSGTLLLQPENPDPEATDRLDVTFQRLPDGGQFIFNELKFAGSDLTGRLRMTVAEPMRYELQLSGGVLDLQPWSGQGEEDSKPKTPMRKGATEDTLEVARNVGGFLGRLVGLNDTPVKPGERLFSSEAFDLEPLGKVDIRIQGELGRIYSAPLVAEDVTVDAHIGGGTIALNAAANQANGGPLSVELRYATEEPNMPLTLEIQASGVHREPQQSSYPTFVHGKFESFGVSEAELAAHLDGQAFFQLGRGPIDYGGLAFITADVASSMFRTLIPGAKDRVPEVQCGASLLQFTDGVGVTPYGYAVKTGSANLLGGVEFNLVDEKLRVRFRSRSREGAGLSVGNAFAGSVELAGPLNNPKIVPNTPGLLFRGWAAFMTGGLSVLGESVFNRMLASSDPCGDIQREIRKDLCSSDQLLSSSPLACPTEKDAAN